MNGTVSMRVRAQDGVDGTRKEDNGNGRGNGRGKGRGSQRTVLPTSTHRTASSAVCCPWKSCMCIMGCTGGNDKVVSTRRSLKINSNDRSSPLHVAGRCVRKWQFAQPVPIKIWPSAADDWGGMTRQIERKTRCHVVGSLTTLTTINAISSYHAEHELCVT